MDPKTLTDYELRRFENMRRNSQMLAALVPVHLRPASRPKRTRPVRPQPRSEGAAVRFSRRCRGIPPPPDLQPPPCQISRTNGILRSIRESSSDLLNAMLASDEDWAPGSKALDLDPRSELVLRSENVRNVGNEPIYSMGFVPLRDRKVIVVGNRIGNLGFWDVDFSLDGEGIYLYQPHWNQVSGISVHPYSPRKIYTCSTDGSVRLMDVEKETFDKLLSSEHSYNSICQCPQDKSSLFIGEGAGMLKFWDEREGKASLFWKLHGDRINTIDFNPENTDLMATSSTDGSYCIWDLRSMKKESPESMKSFSHHLGAVHSAYFSPTGKYLASTTSAGGGRVGIASVSDFDDPSRILQINWTSTPFRAIWGWDESYIFVGNKNKAINVISTGETTVTELTSSYMTSIPCRLAAHSHLNMGGYLAGASAGGKIYLWTKE